MVFGTTLGAGGAVVATAPLISSGCSLHSGDDDWHGIIDAPLPHPDANCLDAACPDAWYVPIFDAGWGIIDAPQQPDAAPPDAGLPDAAVAAVPDPTDPTGGAP